MNKITFISEFDQLLADKKPFYFFKHSLTCPISAAAFDEYKKFNEVNEANSYYLAIQESRDLSAHVAQALGVKHESPQAFYIKDGEATWNASHGKITIDSLKEQQ